MGPYNFWHLKYLIAYQNVGRRKKQINFRKSLFFKNFKIHSTLTSLSTPNIFIDKKFLVKLNLCFISYFFTNNCIIAARAIRISWLCYAACTGHLHELGLPFSSFLHLHVTYTALRLHRHQQTPYLNSISIKSS